MASPWAKTTIKDDDGKVRDAVAPVIISASRSTDIPAFYSEWLIHRLQRGYCVWTNPFNRVSQYVSFEKARFFVFWSKNPRALIERLPEFERRDIGYYIQFTLNDYDDEQYEPNVPAVAARVETFKRLVDHIGDTSRVIWRFDPLMLTDRVTVEILLDRIERLMSQLHPYTRKFVFSFADLLAYPKVEQNLRRAGIAAVEFDREQMEATARGIQKLAAHYRLSAGTCAEHLDLDALDIAHNRCIDADLIAKCRPHDRELMTFLGRDANAIQTDFFAGATALRSANARQLKDSGQREDCGCMVSKDIGSYNTCPHLCVYCYANGSPDSVARRYRLHRPAAESV